MQTSRVVQPINPSTPHQHPPTSVHAQVAAKSITQHIQFHDNLSSRLEATVQLINDMEQKMKSEGEGNPRSSKVPLHLFIFRWGWGVSGH